LKKWKQFGITQKQWRNKKNDRNYTTKSL
jgi:hypothetical protein